MWFELHEIVHLTRYADTLMWDMLKGISFLQIVKFLNVWMVGGLESPLDEGQPSNLWLALLHTWFTFHANGSAT